MFRSEAGRGNPLSPVHLATFLDPPDNLDRDDPPRLLNGVYAEPRTVGV